MALSKVRRIPIGAGISLITGVFTNTEGAAPQTVNIGKAALLWGAVRPNVTAEPVDHRGDLLDTAASGDNTVVTIRALSGITAGRFVMLIDEGGG